MSAAAKEQKRIEEKDLDLRIQEYLKAKDKALADREELEHRIKAEREGDLQAMRERQQVEGLSLYDAEAARAERDVEEMDKDARLKDQVMYSKRRTQAHELEQGRER